MENRISKEGLKSDGGADWFWTITEQANRDPKKLEQILQKMSHDEIVRFAHEFEKYACELVWPLVERTSEDGAKDIADWVVSQGKTFYNEIRNHPERVPFSLDEEQESTLLSGVADNIFWARYREVIPPLRE
jgi:hypothetical protein